MALNQPTRALRKSLYQTDIDSLVHIARELRSHRRQRKGELNSVSLTGQATELIFSTLVNSQLHPNLIAVPSLPFQDASKDRELNHDYLFIDNYRDSSAMALPVQIKSNFWQSHHTSYGHYDPSVAIIIGSADLHECQLRGYENCHSTACFIQQGLRRALADQSSNERYLANILTNRLLLKLTAWPTSSREWGETHNYIAYVQALAARAALRHAVPSQPTVPPKENLLMVSRFSFGAGGET